MTLEAAVPNARRRLGVTLVLVSALAWSVGGVMAKMVRTDAWTATLVRALAAAVFLLVLLVIQQRSGAIEVLVRSAKAAPASILVGALSMVLLIGAFFHSTVANVTVIYATAPFWSAAMLWVLLGVSADRRTMVASLIALVGVLIVIGGGFDGAHVFGDLLAVGMTATFIYAAIALKRAPQADATAVSLLSCIACVVFCLPLASLSTLTASDAGWLTLYGITTSGLAYVCFMAGARLISTTEAGLLGVIEVALAPLWSFLVLSEIPSMATFVGGGVIIAVVLWHLAGQSPQGEAA